MSVGKLLFGHEPVSFKRPIIPSGCRWQPSEGARALRRPNWSFFTPSHHTGADRRCENGCRQLLTVIN